MGSGEDDEGNSKSGNLIVDGSDTETQTFDTQSPSSSSVHGEKLEDGNADESHSFQNTVPFDTIPFKSYLDETQVVNLDVETQVIDFPDWVENRETQLLDGCEKEDVLIDSDGEGTDRTEVLIDAEGVSDDDSERGIGDDPVGLEKRQRSPLYGEERNNFVVDSDALADEVLSSGSVPRGNTAVCAASLEASGLAARSMTPKETHAMSSSHLSNSQYGKEHLHTNNDITGIRYLTSVDAEVKEVDCDHDSRIKGLRDETECRVGNPTVRKLFDDDTLFGNNESASNIDDKNEETDLPQLLARNHEFAGLSYLGSQQPGEQSQTNALDVVDNFLSVNYVELSQEVDPGTAMKGKSSPVLNAKGPQSLAKRSNLANPVGVTAVFDWVDSREDDGGGDLFTKRKESFFESIGRGRRSRTEPKNSRCKRRKVLVDKFGQNEVGLHLHQNMRGLTLSDSRLLLQNSKEVHLPEIKSKKNLNKELNDEQLNAEFPGKMLEAPGTSKDTLDVYDVGFDTQMAAEAMEALFCGSPAKIDADDAHQVTKNVTESSPSGATKKKARSKHVSPWKRACPSDAGGITRQSKRASILDTKSSKEALTSSHKRCKNPRAKKVYPYSKVKTKVKRGKLKGEQHLESMNATSENETPGRRSFKFVEQGKTLGAVDTVHVEDAGRCRSLFTSNGHLSLSKEQLQEDHWTFTPIAHRTRQCTTVNPLKRTDDSGEGKNDLVEVGIHGGKRKGNSLGVDMSKLLICKRINSKLCSNQIGEIGKDKVNQQEQPGLGRSHEETAATTSCVIRDALSYPRRRRTRRNLSSHLNKGGNLDDWATVIKGKEANKQSITGQKSLKGDVRSTCSNSDMKRKTGSAIYPYPFLSSPIRNSEENLARKNFVDPGSSDAAVNSVLAVVHGNMTPKKLVVAKAFTHSGRKDDSSEGAEVDAILEALPTEKVEPSCSACTTPSNGITPINATSPVCLGKEYHKQSCRKILSRSSLMKELIRLDATEAVSNPELKDFKRRRREIANVRVLFSHHLDEDVIKQQKKILARLGVSIASSSSDATHFIADKFVRTRNMLEAIALGKPVVTNLWLEICGQASCLVDEKNYILRDYKKEKEIGFSMQVSLARASQCPLLQGKRVFITPNIKPDKELIASLVMAVHGQAVERIGRSAIKDDEIPDDLLVLSCEEDYAICLPLLEKGALVYSSELLLNGIVIQKLAYERHRLFVDHVKKTRSTIWLRNDGNQFLPVAK